MTPALLLALATAGPAAHAGDKITVTPTAVENVRVGMTGGSFDLVLTAERHRGLPVKLRSLDYELLLGSVVVTEAEEEYTDVVLRRGEPATFRIPVRLDARTAMAAGASALSSGSMDLRLRGEAGVRVLIFPIRLDFDERLATGGR